MSRHADLALPVHDRPPVRPRGVLVRVLPVLLLCATVWAGMGAAPGDPVALGQGRGRGSPGPGTTSDPVCGCPLTPR